MLDEIRRHAANWVVKLTLGIIIFTFIAFFGWSRVADRYQDAHIYVASVEGQTIPRRKFENLYQSSVDQLRQNISGDLPANMEDLLRKNVLDQLVTRELVVRYAKDLGLSVTDEEVASYIRNNSGLFPDGTFDLRTYEREFLPSYRQRNGEDFEEAIRRDLLVEKANLLMTTLYGPWEDELDRSLEEIWTARLASQKKPETAPLMPSVSSASPLDLFSAWVQNYRQEIKIETY